MAKGREDGYSITCDDWKDWMSVYGFEMKKYKDLGRDLPVEYIKKFWEL